MNSIRTGIAALPIVVGMVAGVALPLSAQTTTPSPTCSVAPTSISTLSIERVLTLSNLLTTIPPNVPANVLAGIASGAQEIRSRLIYNPQLNTLTDTTFLVAPGSPLPTPLGVDVTQSTITGYSIAVSKIYTSCQPTPSVLVVGTISGSAVSPFGNFGGALAAVSIGYTTDTPAKINNVVELIAGQVVAYSASAMGSLTFPVVTVTPPGSNPGAPTVVLFPSFTPQGMGVNQIFTSPYQLNATSSTDPNNLALTFMWSSDKPANFSPSNTVSNPAITFGSGSGDYTITLTVTNSAGKVSTATFVLEYVGQQ